MNRTPFIDHLRVAMTALVVFHHAAITYGAEGGGTCTKRVRDRARC